MEGSSRKNEKGSQIKWSEPMDGVLIDALLQQQLVGNKINGQWTTSSYEIMVKELREKLGLPLLKKEHLQNRQKTLKKNFNDAYDMFKNSSGFGWDEESKLFTAEPEVWKSLIEVKPEAKKWITTSIPYYDKLLELYAKDRANGEASLTAKERARQKTNTEKYSPPNTIDDIDELLSQNEITLENICSDTSGYGKLPTSTKINSDNKVENSCKGKKRKGSPDGEYEIHVLKDGLDSVAEAIREGNSILKHMRPRIYSSHEIFQELINLEVEENEQFKAYRFLNANQTRVREFFGCPQRIRKAFLKRMMDEDGVY